MRLFLAHSISHSDNEIEQFKSDIRAIFAFADMPDVEIVEGREDFKANFATAGGWRGWPHDVVTRRDYLTQDYVYTAFVVPGLWMGKATGQMLEYAAERGRPIFSLGDDGLRAVTKVSLFDSQDAKTGWKAEVGELMA